MPIKSHRSYKRGKQRKRQTISRSAAAGLWQAQGTAAQASQQSGEEGSSKEVPGRTSTATMYLHCPLILRFDILRSHRPRLHISRPAEACLSCSTQRVAVLYSKDPELRAVETPESRDDV